MIDLIRKFQNISSYKIIRDRLSAGSGLVPVNSLYGSARSLLIAGLYSDLGKPFVIVTSSQDEAEKLGSDLSWLIGRDSHIFPEWHSHIYADASPPKGVVADHMSALYSLLVGHPIVLVCPISALIHKVVPRSALARSAITIEERMEISPAELADRLIRCGYEKVAMVEAKGQFAMRGGIFDLYPTDAESPIRCEFFGDEIDTIRYFDPVSQRSTGSTSQVVILPSREFIIDAESIEGWASQFEEIYAEETDPRIRDKLLEIDMRVNSMEDLDGLDPYLPLIHPDAETVLDYLPEDAIVAVDEVTWISREVERLMEGAEKIYQKRHELGHFSVTPNRLFVSYDQLVKQISRFSGVSLSLVGHGEPDAVEFSTRSLGIHGNVRIFLEELRGWQEKGYSVQIICESENRIRRMDEVIDSYGLDKEKTGLIVGRLADGFISDELKLILFSDAEIFSHRVRSYRRRKKRAEGSAIISYSDLNEGDYVVHVSHGIGVYQGIKRLKIEDAEQDFLVIRYAGGDLLYVPTYQIDLVQKYIGGSEESRVKMDRLGGSNWSRVKQRVKESVEKMARELLQLYAARQAMPGFAFSADVPWQREFEALFPYEETPDQLRAIEEVKRDMEKPTPMDRLICGDVGYGKTEVAMRAAFKAVMDNKQVALLVPTTVLAQQHYFSFKDRFADFPIEIAMLSRFQSLKERREIIDGLKRGTVDIIIGTHMLLAKEIKFNDLGLLIIDEEHRFGVAQKERLKQLKQQVDVLTMTATPIPRTLYMSVSGIRDMSLIETPPENRLPIETYVMGYDQHVIREAILDEMARGGQVFFVHNRVETIDSIAANLQKLVPEARIAVGHGQMSERMLEKVILDFVARKYDVLVCTTIIESGIDMPNVNTIIVDRADMLGLAQLYQLRGRVGRSNAKAYGYMFYPRDRSITEGAQKRLRVIEEFSDLGSGFKIALRDMEIRGMGNILGPEQHGHINAVGYELYSKLLSEAVRKLRGERIEDEETDVHINLPIRAYIPDGYVPDSFQKVSLYKRIASAKTADDIEDLLDEMRDRFGEPPKQVLALLDIADLKQTVTNFGVESVSASKKTLDITFNCEKAKIDTGRLIDLVQKDRRVTLTPPGRLSIRLGESFDMRDVPNLIKDTLEYLTPKNPQPKEEDV